ncbi:MAG: peptide deformylase [Ignavibacteriales bacterium]|nr:peptide deformylase [Ignavibacteriales bacterium]
MSTLPVYLYGNEILKKKAKPVSEITDGEIELIKDMFDTMHTANGIGLAANQVGELKQILVIDISDMEAGKGIKPLVVINPEILSESDEESEYEEGCLSIPDVREKVWRPEKITLKYCDINMKEVNLEADGILARVLQHEIDHLNGILFLDHLTGTKRTLLRGKLSKISKGEIETQYDVVAPKKLKPKKKK